MSDDEETDDGPAVELGEGDSVAGAPLARVSSRLTWGIEHSTIVEREGDSDIRTPDGPQPLADLMADVDVPYFEHRREFESAVRGVLGDGPVATE
ncbi:MULTISPECIES: DUF5789 family protein [Halomicrobium]|uniref:Uncharacterized protein n=2 Tax=Halomicrobium mukohataei TaxID=57705 RepID=C7P2H9_HALMD|nr:MULTISPECIES: DUF5789 family protein [Halomicrobium]ACV49294.1 conserved hypothetical protein [Halomicrobium mukohataei DSM 12286]QCD64693.1 hypothetical protein E5139_03175 [Halomicrobium mukohataei]QFR19500.1 hypothetical protein GBQ70_03175 [Halomicrobium sp. ZPS1]